MLLSGCAAPVFPVRGRCGGQRAVRVVLLACMRCRGDGVSEERRFHGSKKRQAKYAMQPHTGGASA